MSRLLLCLALVMAVTACGQRGPLFLRDNPPPGYKPPKTDAYKPVPYPDSTERDGATEK